VGKASELFMEIDHIFKKLKYLQMITRTLPSSMANWKKHWPRMAEDGDSSL
jgi:hypothetical protein